MKLRRIGCPTRKEVVLLLFPLFGLAAPLAYYLRGDGLDQKLRSMAGPQAINCGEITAKETMRLSGKAYNFKGDLLEACADQAYDAGKPFYMRQWVHMDGIRTTIGYVGTSDGKLYTIVYGVPRGVPFFIGKLSRVNTFKPNEPIKPRPGDKHIYQKNRYWLFR